MKDYYTYSGEKLLDSFSRNSGNTLIVRKTDVCRKTAKTRIKIPGQSTPLIQPFCTYDDQVPPESSLNSPVERSKFFCMFSANRPVERSKLVLAVHPAVAPAMRPAMRPAVPHPNQIYKLKFMKNADAKLQALQYLVLL